MDIAKGFQMTEPNVFISWNINAEGLIDLFNEYHLKKVTDKYYTADCTSLNGLKCKIGFHFEPRDNGQLLELEFFRTSYDDQEISFTEFQTYFEAAFGEPTSVTKGDGGFNDYEWLLENVTIIHLVYDRYGPEEHMRIKKNSYL